MPIVADVVFIEACWNVAVVMPLNITIPLTSQIPGVRIILVTLVTVVVVDRTEDPVAMADLICSPMKPAAGAVLFR